MSACDRFSRDESLRCPTAQRLRTLTRVKFYVSLNVLSRDTADLVQRSFLNVLSSEYDQQVQGVLSNLVVCAGVRFNLKFFGDLIVIHIVFPVVKNGSIQHVKKSVSD